MGYPMLGLGVNYSIISKNEMSTSLYEREGYDYANGNGYTAHIPE